MTLTILNGSKRLADKVILDDVTVTFDNGYIYGLKGDNGSGKTVILKLLAGYYRLDTGEVYQDKTLIRKSNNYITDAGLVIEHVEFLPYLTLLENLKLLKHLSPKITDESIDYWIDYYGLGKFKTIAYKNLSLGTKQKLALIQAFIHQPKILLLDEPMNALDEKSVALTKDLIRSYGQAADRLVIMTSHISENISDLCHVTCLLKNGKLYRQ
ncbi:ATP-binding cassette domain-containing protein [Streptococcus sp. E24BD]|uniref:ABC transporter ATP-binding protein n=1 Tax=Streptococcus sp. E24BD TaxID=3278715 RepID=UPI00359E311A